MDTGIFMKLSKSARKILNDPVRIEQRDLWLTKLQNLYDGQKADTVMALFGVLGKSDDDNLLYSNPEQWVIECLENLAQQIEMSESDIQFIPPCIEPLICGMHFVDSIFGLHVYHHKEADTWYSEHINTDVGYLKYPDFEKSETWNIVIRTVKSFFTQEVALPFFCLPLLSSALVVAVNLYGENILSEALLEPENADRDLTLINNLLIDIHNRFRSILPPKQMQLVIGYRRTQPPGYGQLCGCTAQLVSNEFYNTHVAALDNHLLGIYPKGGMIHFCGNHSHLIPSLRSMSNVKAVQLNDRATHDLELYYKNLREDQIIYYNPSEKMPIERAMEITGGKRLVIVDRIDTPLALKGYS